MLRDAFERPKDDVVVCLVCPQSCVCALKKSVGSLSGKVFVTADVLMFCQLSFHVRVYCLP